MESDRVRTIAEWPEPTCHHDIQVLLGFAYLNRRFISIFSCLAKPMTDMLNGGKNSLFSGLFLPTPAMKWSFVELCNSFTEAPVLADIDAAKSIRLMINASGFAIAVIILQ